MALNIESLLPRVRAAESWARGTLSQAAGREPREPLPVSRHAEIAALQTQLNQLEAPFGSPAAGAVVEMLPLAAPILAGALSALPRGASRLVRGKDRPTAMPAARQSEPEREKQVRARLQSVLGELDTLQASLQNRSDPRRTIVRSLQASLRSLAWPVRRLAGQAGKLAKPVRTRIGPDRHLARVRAACGGAIDRALRSAAAAARGLRSSIGTGRGTVGAARHLNQGSAVLAGSVLLYTAVEHYRGRLGSRAMYLPMVVSALTLATNAHGTADRRPMTHHVRQAVAVAAAGLGLLGAGLHIFNGRGRLGQGVSSRTAVPAMLGSVAAGLLGATAEWMRRPRERHRRFGFRVSGVPGWRRKPG
jgi:hypothetical protein